MRYDLSYGANASAVLGGRMTPVSLFLSSAGVWLTIISCDRPGACPASRPGSCLIVCHPGHERSRGRATGWTTAQPRQSLLSGIPACAHKRAIFHTHTRRYRGIIVQSNSKGNVEEDRRRLFTGLTLMPCGLYIWLAARLSLYPPVWLITWRRVSTWNGGGHTHRQREWSDKSWG